MSVELCRKILVGQCGSIDQDRKRGPEKSVFRLYLIILFQILYLPTPNKV